MSDEKVPTVRRRGQMTNYVQDQEGPPYSEPDFDQDEKVPTGDAWDMFHTYVEIGAMETSDLGTLLMSAVTLRHAFEYLNHDSTFIDLAQSSGHIKKGKPNVEDWLRAECRLRLGTKVAWFEQLRELANFTKHAQLNAITSIFGADPPVPVSRTGTMTRWEEPRVYRSIWELANLPSTITRTTLTMSAEGKISVAFDVEETLYQMRMFFYDVMEAHRPDRLKARPMALSEGD
jgi:hypothetical protein